MTSSEWASELGMAAEFSRGDLVWFDPGIGYVLPGEVTEFHPQAQVSALFLIPETKQGKW